MQPRARPIADFHPLPPKDAARLPRLPPLANPANPANPSADHMEQQGFAALEPHLGYLHADDRERVRQAYRFADTAHLGQMRRSGLPYITHPLAVAAMCTRWHLDAEGLMASLLHDVIEDCAVEKKELVEHFGPAVAELVDGLTKLDKLQFSTHEESQAENFRKMLVTMARDMRVILVKLADRTHNMRTLSDVSRSKWGRISRETLDIYLPLAQRLGLHALYRELQDLVFQHLYPWRFAVLRKAMARARKRRLEWLSQVQMHVQQTLQLAGLQAQVSSREKTLFSIYLKMRDKRMSFAQMGDIYGFRVIVPNTTECYTALGVLHQMYRPVPGRFKDHIAIPKANSYQSLHTTLAGPSGLHIEFQFRTDAMHAVAESGVAAHWSYKQGLDSSQIPAKQNVSWLQSLLDIQNETRDATEFWEHIKIDLIPDAVYVFTPKGRILALPRGATVADFAYAIHTDVGDHMIAAKVNGESAPLRTELRNGDSVEVITAPSAQPNPDWLIFVITGRARSKIRHFLKTQEQDASRQLGEKLLRQALRAEGMAHYPDATRDKPLWDKLLHFSGNRSVEDLLIDLGLGKRLPPMVAKRMAALLAESGVKPDALMLSQHYLSRGAEEAQGRPSLVIDGNEPRSMVQYAPCCLPIPHEAITGYMGRGEGLQVHRIDCHVAKRSHDKDAERFIKLVWSDDIDKPYTTRIQVKTQSKQGSMARIANIIANCETDIAHISSSTDDHFGNTVILDLTLIVRDLNQLQQTLRALQRDPLVISAERGALKS